jgi:hypothetical protein
MEAIRSSETSVYTIYGVIPEDGLLHVCFKPEECAERPGLAPDMDLIIRCQALDISFSVTPRNQYESCTSYQFKRTATDLLCRLCVYLVNVSRRFEKFRLTKCSNQTAVVGHLDV